MLRTMLLACAVTGLVACQPSVHGPTPVDGVEEVVGDDRDGGAAADGASVPTTDDDPPGRDAGSASSDHSGGQSDAATNGDICADSGWYGDRMCDTFCPLRDPDCDDACVTNQWYGDGLCDDFCAQPDPDCSTSSCPLNAHLNIDGYCYCDDGYRVDAAGTACEPDSSTDGGVPPVIGTVRTLFTSANGAIGGVAVSADQVYVMEKSWTEMYHYPRLHVHRFDTSSNVSWDLVGEIEAEGGAIDVAFGYVYVADSAGGGEHRGRILRLPITPGGNPNDVLALKYSITGPRHIRFADGWVYFAQAGFDQIWRTSAADATNADETVATCLGCGGPVLNFSLQADQLATLHQGGIARGTISDLDSFAVVTNVTGGKALVLDGDEVFFTSVVVYGGGDVRGTVTRYNLSTNQATVLIGDVEDLSLIALQGDQLYYTGAGGVFRIARTGGVAENVAAFCAPSSLAVSERGVAFACSYSAFWVPLIFA